MTRVSASALPGIPPDLIPSLVAQVKGTGRLALVGGAVRDALLHDMHQVPCQTLPDLDLVYEGSCSELASGLQETLGLVRVPDLRMHDQFGTAELVLDGVLLDLAAARTEIYPAPGQNPLVHNSSLEKDLARRDFTVNAMALVLQADGNQILLDLFDGQEHLAKRQLAFLHERSVEDDPTRVLRAARYCARLGFSPAPTALLQMHSTIGLWPWAWRLGDPVDSVPPALGTRLRMELELLLDREPWAEALGLLRSWSVMPLLDPCLQSDTRLIRRLHQASRLGLPALAVLVAAASDPRELALRLQIPGQQQRWLEALLELRRWIVLDVLPQPWGSWGTLEWTRRLEQDRWPAEVVALAVIDNLPCWRPLLRWWGRWRHVRATESARELIAQGISPGPQLGEALRRSRDQALRSMR